MYEKQSYLSSKKAALPTPVLRLSTTLILSEGGVSPRIVMPQKLEKNSSFVPRPKELEVL